MIMKILGKNNKTGRLSSVTGCLGRDPPPPQGFTPTYTRYNVDVVLKNIV